jgi:hypothetical protein
MGYVIAAILVLLIVAAGVTFFVMRATRTGQEAAIAAPDENTPLGDTDQHAGRQTEEGRTVEGLDGGGADPVRGSRPPAGSGGVGGEGEGGHPPAPDPPAPESERLSDRPR